MFLDLDAQNKSADRLDHHALHDVIHDDSFNRLEISPLECTYSPAAIILIEIHSSSQNFDHVLLLYRQTIYTLLFKNPHIIEK